jgi:hypothetical protein
MAPPAAVAHVSPIGHSDGGYLLGVDMASRGNLLAATYQGDGVRLYDPEAAESQVMRDCKLKEEPYLALAAPDACAMLDQWLACARVR